MAKRWETLEDGRIKLTVSPDRGGPASVFYGTDRDEILDKLADAQAAANGRLEDLRLSVPNGTGSAPPVISPQALTPSERMQTVADLTNPARAVEAIVKVVESRVGPLDSMREDQVTRASIQAAEAFVAETPGWYPSPHNQHALTRYLIAQGLDSTKVDSYRRAFADLGAAKLLQQAPSQASSEAEPDEDRQQGRNGPTPAPRPPTRYSTGVRSSDVSGSQPMPGKRLKYSRDEIRGMSASTYKQKMMSDPEFSRCVEFYAKGSAMRRAAAPA